MRLREYAARMKSWAEKNGVTLLRYEISNDLPAQSDLYEIGKHHPGLIDLYADSNGINVVWESEEGDAGGILQVPSATELSDMLHRGSELRDGYDDSDIVDSGYDQEWWNRNIKIFRSLTMFIHEGNGDGICISSENDKIYFLFHDWMDWVSKEPPMICLADSLQDLFESWSKINFGCPKDLYWMSAVKDGKFTGFNARGFVIR